MTSCKFLYGSFVAAMLAANVAAAQVAPPVGLLRGRAQLQLQLGLVDFSTVHGALESDLGVKSSVKTKSTQYGLASRVGLSLGYGASEHVQLALLAGFAVRTGSSALIVNGESNKDVSTRSSTFAVLPAVRYVAGEGNRRFYVGPAAGYERDGTKFHDGGPDSVSRHGLLGGQLGVYCFVHQNVSLEPGLELYWVRGSTQIAQGDKDDLHRDDNGFRMLLTLGLSVWSEGNAAEAPVAIAAMHPPEPDPANIQTQYAAARIADLGLRLEGNPQRMGTEMTVGLTTHGEEDPPRCDATLTSDEPPQQLELTWWLDGADEAGALQSGSGRARVKLLEQWLAHNPSLTVCKRTYVVSAEVRTVLQAALVRFQNEAVSAGTRQPEPMLSEREPAPPGNESRSP